MIDWDYVNSLEVSLLEPREQFDKALLGIAESCGSAPKAAYSRELVIECLKEEMSEEEAEEWFSYNILGSYLGEGAPTFVEAIAHPLEDAAKRFVGVPVLDKDEQVVGTVLEAIPRGDAVHALLSIRKDQMPESGFSIGVEGD